MKLKLKLRQQINQGIMDILRLQSHLFFTKLAQVIKASYEYV